MNITGAGIIGVANEQIHEAHDGWLRRQVAHVGGAFVVVVDARQFDVTSRARGEALDRPFDIAAAGGFDDDVGLIDMPEIVQRVVK